MENPTQKNRLLSEISNPAPPLMSLTDQRCGAAPLGNQEGGVPGPAPQGTHPQLLSVASVPSGPASPPRDGQISATGKGGRPRKKRKASSTPGETDLREAWPQLAFDSERCGLVPSQSEKCWPRYLVVEAENPSEPLSKLSPWAIQKGFAGISPSITNVKCLGKGLGQFLVECPTERIAKMLLARNGTTFVDRKIKVSAHRTLNACRGVVTSKVLARFDPNHLTEGLEDQGVTKVQRLTKGKGESAKPTDTYFLSFATPTPPEFIKIPFVARIPVRKFVQKPLQCFNCWRYGHPQSKCQANKVCRHCGSQAHEGACPTPTVCCNCRGEHSPADRSCPTYLKEAAIQKVRAEQRISFAEARKFVEAAEPKGQSFSGVAASAANQQGGSTNQQGRPTRTPVAAPKPVRSIVTQFPDNLDSYELPEAIVAEALHLARELRDKLKNKTQTASTQFSAEAASSAKQKEEKKKKKAKSATSAAKAVRQTFGSATLAAKAAKQAQGSAEQVPKPANTSSLAKPGEASALPPKNAEEKQAEGPALGKRDGNTRAQAPQAAAGIPGQPSATPAGRSGGASGSAPKPAALPTSGKGDTAGFTLKAPTLKLGHGVAVKQKEGPALVNKQGVTPAPAPQAAAGNHTPHSPMEVAHPPAPAHQAAGGKAPSTSPSGRGALSSLGAKIGEMFGGRASAATKPKERKKWRSASNLIGTKTLNLLDREQPISLKNSFDPLDSLSADQPLPKPPLHPFEGASEEDRTEWG